MKTRVAKMFGIEYPIFAFSHCRDVVIAVSKAGGMGIFGAANIDAEGLDRELSIIDDELQGVPYGVDVLLPAAGTEPLEKSQEAAPTTLPESHRRFVEQTLRDLGAVDLPPTVRDALPSVNLLADGVGHAEVAMEHRISFLVSALGSPSRELTEEAHGRDITVGALAGKVGHALRHVENGVDIVVAQGYEAGGHTGEVATMVHVPGVIDAIGSTPVLAAGGIGSGRQMAAAMALGADGVWMGSIWLMTEESESLEFERSAYMAASSDDTLRSRIRSGKPVRMLRSRWTDAWDEEGAPSPLNLSQQPDLVEEAHERLRRTGDATATPALPVGQIVGRMNAVRSCRDVVYDLVVGYSEAVERLDKTLSQSD